MPVNRFYIDSPLEKGAIFSLENDEHHHVKVMRLNEGNTIEVINGKNQLALADITKISKKTSEITLTKVDQKNPPNKRVYLIQAYTKPNKLELIIEKGTELGVTDFIFFSSEKAEKAFPKEKRHKTILISSIKQCGRLDLPNISYENKIPKLNDIHLFYGDVKKEAKFFPVVLKSLESKKHIGFINGPESGFSLSEHKTFEEKFDAIGVSLHQNVLRTETAAIVATSFCQIYQR